MTTQQSTVKRLSGMSDEDLMDLMKEGDEKALEVLMKRLKRIMMAIVYRKLGSITETDEAFYEIFLVIFNKASDYRREAGSAKSWISSVFHNRTVDLVRRKISYNRVIAMNIDIGDHDWITRPSITTGAEAIDSFANIEELVSRLPEAQKNAIIMNLIKGMSQRQISNATGIPLGTIKTRIELGLKKLRLAISDQAATESAFMGGRVNE